MNTSQKPSFVFLVGLAWLLVLPAKAAANMSYTPWVHELTQEGQDVKITVQVFEDSTGELFDTGLAIPDLSSAYTLTRLVGGADSPHMVLEGHVFQTEDAFAVTEHQCQVWNTWSAEECPDSEQCEDCDEDGDPECYGFCAVAYQFLVVDECVPPGDVLYNINTPETESVHGGEGLGFTNMIVEDTGASCLDDSDNGCSVARVSGNAEHGLIVFMLGIGLTIIILRKKRAF